MPKYIAKQSIGHYRPGEEIKGLESNQLQALLASGAIEEEKVLEQPKSDGFSAQLASLEAEVADLKVNEVILTEAKDKAEKEVTDLKVKVSDLEKSLTASEKKVAAEVKKITTETK